jgi:hypothetical protein
MRSRGIPTRRGVLDLPATGSLGIVPVSYRALVDAGGRETARFDTLTEAATRSPLSICSGG